MDELWFALPSLRELLSFERGWGHAMERAWIILFRAVRGNLPLSSVCKEVLTMTVYRGRRPDVLRIPPHNRCHDGWYHSKSSSPVSL